MAHIDALVDKVSDPALREALREQVDLLMGKRSFGLVFQEHRPETVELPNYRVRRGCKVRVWDEDDKVLYRVDRLILRRDGWSADVAVENRSPRDFQIRRPHRPGGSLFGLVLLESESRKELSELTAGLRKEPPFLQPDRIAPAPAHQARWSGCGSVRRA